LPVGRKLARRPKQEIAGLGTCAETPAIAAARLSMPIADALGSGLMPARYGLPAIMAPNFLTLQNCALHQVTY
jgi:hypothetical protein|tara:strand:+ start:42383 stop:42601 length:219 start_codon:yes stop_codon:yes gene_type:complete